MEKEHKILIGLVIANLVISLITLNQVFSLQGTGLNAPTPAEKPQEPEKPIQVSLDNDPMLGNKDAKVTIVEFSDFQCPYCGRFYVQTESQLKKDYIDTGKVNFVYRDFPLGFHPNAEPAAEAAECANEQGKFWEMHNKIFENQESMSTESYKQWAKDLGLDTNKFNSCFDSQKYKDEVKKDEADGEKYRVSGTPTFFIGNPKSGYIRLVGAQPYEAFKQVLDQLLK